MTRDKEYSISRTPAPMIKQVHYPGGGHGGGNTFSVTLRNIMKTRLNRVCHERHKVTHKVFPLLSTCPHAVCTIWEGAMVGEIPCRFPCVIL